MRLKSLYTHCKTQVASRAATAHGHVITYFFLLKDMDEKKLALAVQPPSLNASGASMESGDVSSFQTYQTPLSRLVNASRQVQPD